MTGRAHRLGALLAPPQRTPRGARFQEARPTPGPTGLGPEGYPATGSYLNHSAHRLPEVGPSSPWTPIQVFSCSVRPPPAPGVRGAAAVQLRCDARERCPRCAARRPGDGARYGVPANPKLQPHRECQHPSAVRRAELEVRLPPAYHLHAAGAARKRRTMRNDPIIDEIRTIRESIAREHDYDLESVFRMLQEAASASGRERVSPTPPEVTTTATAAAHRGGVVGGEHRTK